MWKWCDEDDEDEDDEDEEEKDDDDDDDDDDGAAVSNMQLSHLIMLMVRDSRKVFGLRQSQACHRPFRWRVENGQNMSDKHGIGCSSSPKNSYEKTTGSIPK